LEGSATELVPIPNESRIRVTGVCLVHANDSRVPDSFRLLLRSTKDLVLLRRPVWWTRMRLIEIACAATVVLLLFAVWSVVLSRKHAALRREMRERQEAAAALHRTRDQLARRVAGPTRQLSEANAALKNPIAERALAEICMMAVDVPQLLDQERARF